MSLLTEQMRRNRLDRRTLLSRDDFVSPVRGVIMDLSVVPDPIFSEKIMGDGFAIDPVDELFVSPVDGEVISVLPTKHAIGIRSKQGVEFMLHIGLDTVKLQGEGFTGFVQAGDQLKKGDHLVHVDFDYINEHQLSLITPIIFTNLSDQFVHLLQGGLVPAQAKEIIEIRHSYIFTGE